MMNSVWNPLVSLTVPPTPTPVTMLELTQYDDEQGEELLSQCDSLSQEVLLPCGVVVLRPENKRRPISNSSSNPSAHWYAAHLRLSDSEWL